MTRQEFEHIAKTLRPELLAVGRDFFADQDTAEDVAQDVLIRLWQMRQRIGDIKDIRQFALRMAKNACIDEWRIRRQRQTEQLDEDVESVQEKSFDRLEIEDYKKQILKAVKRLPKYEQRLFLIYHEKDLDIGQIAAVTGMSPRTVSAILSSARKKLIEILRKGGNAR